MEIEEKSVADDSKQEEYVPAPSFERAVDLLNCRNRYKLPNNTGKSAKKSNSKSIGQASNPAKDKKAQSSVTESKSDKIKKFLLRLATEAKRESQLEELYPFSTPTHARRKLIEQYISLSQRGAKLSEKQIQFMFDFLYCHPKAVEPKHIKFLIPKIVESKGYTQAIRMTNDLSYALGGTKYEKPLKDYGAWLIKKSKIDKIKEMKSQGLSSAQIGEKLGMSSAEVTILAENNETFVFDEDGSR